MKISLSFGDESMQMLLTIPGLSLAQTTELETGWLTGVLLELARGGTEWILWILMLLFFGVFIVFFERLLFYRSVREDSDALRGILRGRVNSTDNSALVDELKDRKSMQAKVLAYGLADAHRGPEAVEALCDGAIGTEKLRYEKRLNYLATVGSNAPFIGLFGTVIGVIMAFEQLQAATAGGGSGSPGGGVMSAIAEALIATGVGLLVAIPAIIFYNVLKSQVQRNAAETRLLVKTTVAYLRSDKTSD